ncbi:MAG: hypothetical protein IT366_21580 [Candidatus Hydrogenedentes bacterium]|nr:hypothetical protein [Candidatus Hydrogenedentota bacterium]
MSDSETCAVCGVSVDEPRVQLIEGNFSRIRVRAQDVVVVCSKARLSQDQIRGITDGLRPMFPGNKIVVLDEGLEIGVMAPVRDEDCDQDEDDGA